MQSREKYIDIAKGIAMILVVFGHCKYTNNYLLVWLYSFHMPLFFILSGMTFSIKNKPNFKIFIKNKIFKLVIPYFLLLVVLWLLTAGISIVFDGYDYAYLKSFIGIIISNRATSYYLAMWFVLVTFEAEILFYFILRLIQYLSKALKNWMYIMVSIISLTIGIIILRYTKGLMFCLDLLPFGLGFITIGNYIKENKEVFLKVFKAKFFIIVFLVFNLLFTFLNYNVAGKIDLYESNIGNPIYFIMHSLFGSLFIINISFLIRKNAILEYIGKNTLVFYAFQTRLVIPKVTKVFEVLFEKLNIMSLDGILFVCIVISSLLILALMNEFIKRYMPFLLGKREFVSKGI